MSAEEIRLDQTKKVFDMIADLISKNETCSYRYLIYDMLGFKEENYAELMSGLAITNKLAECETQKEVLNKIKKYCEYNDDSLYTFEPDYDYEENIVDKYEPSNFREDILELLEEIE